MAKVTLATKKIAPPVVGEEPIEEEQKESKEEVTELPTNLSKPGDMDNYTKEIDYGVLDEEGNRIPCRSFVEAKILSLLLELKLEGGK